MKIFIICTVRAATAEYGDRKFQEKHPRPIILRSPQPPKHPFATKSDWDARILKKKLNLLGDN